ncbi:MAG: response regulator [Candidatus Methanolliviera hydrocarbonicum]|uniref:Response regulator n=1 Tax=Candidatus Methanolliviera hydrocarbonicum TaxID=2491085 RepID=A0A520L0K7_9EURY|nr:MAG: response regulator [Candidatus Methanolliviera hydrocarbonicum]
MARVLIVDDSAFMRNLLKNVLFKGNLDTVGEATDGEDAITKYKELKPDLVTMDIIMPNKDGIAALKEIRRSDQNAKVIMVTAVGQEKLVKSAIKFGAKGYIVKPFQAPKVIEEVKKVLGIDG